ncbi:MAG: flavin reductase [Fretibacterium sp.]|nr:flavin reductase [Fretibacterium sp.]
MKKIIALLVLSVLAFSVPASADWLKFTGSPHFLPAPLMVVGAYTPEGQANFGVFHRGGVLSSGKDGGPMRIGFGIKGNAEKSFTYQIIKTSGVCTVNLPSIKYLAETDLLGSFSGKAPGGEFQDKLKVTGLTAVRGSEVNAPMIEEFPVSLECELEEDIAIAPDSKSRLMILKVRKVWADEAYLDANGKINPMAKEGGDSSLAFFSHSHGKNGGYFGYGDFLGKSGKVSERFLETK